MSCHLNIMDYFAELVSCRSNSFRLSALILILKNLGFGDRLPWVDSGGIKTHRVAVFRHGAKSDITGSFLC